jgi:two-component SAPR family response regulator
MLEKRYSCIIVEDDPQFAMLMERYVERIPELALMDTFADTTNAARHIEKMKPEIVFLDINISGLEGPEVMSLLDHQPAIIVISAHPESKMDEYDISYTHFLQKPINQAQLQVAVNKCIQQLSD